MRPSASKAWLQPACSCPVPTWSTTTPCGVWLLRLQRCCCSWGVPLVEGRGMRGRKGADSRGGVRAAQHHGCEGWGEGGGGRCSRPCRQEQEHTHRDHAPATCSEPPPRRCRLPWLRSACTSLLDPCGTCAGHADVGGEVRLAYSLALLASAWHWGGRQACWCYCCRSCWCWCWCC